MSRHPKSLQRTLVIVAASLALAACGRPTPLATAAGVTMIGKLKAHALHAASNRFSDHHLVARMAPGARSPIAGVTVRPSVADYQIHALPKGMTLDAAIAAYQKAPGVNQIQKLELYPVEADAPAADVPVPAITIPKSAPVSLGANDPLYYQQWSHAMTNVSRAWTVTKGRSDVVVASLDTGADAGHPDLLGQVIDGPDFAEGKDTSRDIDYHGTHVAGIIAAKADNGQGVAGVAPGCRVLALKIFEPYIEDGRYQGNFYNAFTLARAVQYAATDGGAKVINISAGIADEEIVETMFALARAKGLIICVSAGNKGSNTYTGEAKSMDGVLAVHATDPQDRLARFSNYGNTLGVSAPGMGIMSTVPTYENPFTGAPPFKGGYKSLNGTSMAAPFVAGLAALVTSGLADAADQALEAAGKGAFVVASDIPGTIVEDLIRSTCYDLGRPGRDEVYGCGRVDVERAMLATNDPAWVERTVKDILRNRRR